LREFVVEPSAAQRKLARTLFQRALQVPGPARAAFLEEACEGDAALRRRLDALLQNHHALTNRGEFRLCGRVPQPPLEVGTGTYEIVEQVGTGSMGVVYRARDPVGRVVAVKRVHPAALHTPEVRARFENEIRAVHALQHPGIVTVHSVQEIDNAPCLVMEFVDGGTLAGRLANVPQDAGWAADMVGRIAAAVHHAHTKGIIHRDLTPKNVLITADGRPKIADFGLAALAEEETRITTAGAVLGTPAYMAPEQAGGMAQGVDGRADVYALGVILYEALTGQTPFKGSMTEILHQVRTAEPVAPRRLWPAVPRDLETICLKCLQKAPADRYATAEQLAEDLTRWLEGRPVLARPLGPARRLYRLCRRRPVEAVATLMAVSLLVGGPGVFAWVAWQRAERLAASDRSVNPALQEMFRVWGRAKASAVDDVAAWETTAMAADHLDRLVTEREVGSELAEQVRQTLRDFRDEERDARARAERARRRAEALARDRQFIGDAEGVRIRAPEDSRGFTAGIGADRQYEDVFSRYGLKVLTMSRAEATSRILERSNPTDIAAMLDGWAIARAPEHKWSARDLLALSMEVDRDAFRTDIRLALHSEDLDAIRQLADREEAKSLPMSTMMLMAESLLTMQDPSRVVALLGPRQRSRPDEFWINYYLGKAWTKLDRPNWDEAIRCFSSAAAIRSDSPACQLNLGYAYWRNGNLGEAREAFRTAARLAPDNPAAHYHLGVVLTRLAQYDSGIDEFRTAIRLDPRNHINHMGLGAAFAEFGQFEAAADSFRAAISLAPDNYLAHYNLGEALRKLSDLGNAIRHLDESIRLKPNFPNAHRLLGLVLGEQKEQVERLRPVASLGVALAFGIDGPVAVLPACLVPAALSTTDRNQQESLDRADRLSDGSAKQHFEQGKRWYQRRRPDMAVNEFATAVDLDPDFVEAHVFLALIYRDLGRPDSTIAALRKANTLRPGDDDIVEALGIALANHGQAEEAVRWFRQLVRRVPANGMAHSHLGKALLAAASPEAAVDELRKAVDLDPGHVESLVALGGALRACRRTDEALAVARRAAELAPSSPTTQINLLVLLEDVGDVEEAVSVARSLVRSQPLLVDGWHALGRLLVVTGRPADALKALEVASRLADDGPDGDYEVHLAIRRCKHQVEMDNELPAVLRREVNPSPAEKAQYADLCRRKGQTREAVRLYEEAFGEDPTLASDVLGGHRLGAALAAAALAAGGATSEDESSRTRCLIKARTWLEADLRFWTANIGGKTPVGRAYGYQALKEWRTCRELRPIWSGDRNANLSGPEREAWRKLGAAVEELWRAAEVRDRPAQWADK